MSLWMPRESLFGSAVKLPARLGQQEKKDVACRVKLECWGQLWQAEALRKPWKVSKRVRGGDRGAGFSVVQVGNDLLDNARLVMKGTTRSWPPAVQSRGLLRRHVGSNCGHRRLKPPVVRRTLRPRSRRKTAPR